MGNIIIAVLRSFWGILGDVEAGHNTVVLNVIRSMTTMPVIWEAKVAFILDLILYQNI